MCLLLSTPATPHTLPQPTRLQQQPPVPLQRQKLCQQPHPCCGCHHQRPRGRLGECPLLPSLPLPRLPAAPRAPRVRSGAPRGPAPVLHAARSSNCRRFRPRVAPHGILRRGRAAGAGELQGMVVFDKARDSPCFRVRIAVHLQLYTDVPPSRRTASVPLSHHQLPSTHLLPPPVPSRTLTRLSFSSTRSCS